MERNPAVASDQHGNLFRFEDDFGDVDPVIERADANFAFGEGLVVGSHHGSGHIVVKDLNQPRIAVAAKAQPMPTVIPGSSFGRRQRNLSAVGFVDDEYLISSIVHRFSEVGIVVAIRRLPAEEEAGIAMPIVGFRAAKADVEFEAGDFEALKQRDVRGAAEFRLVVAFLFP